MAERVVHGWNISSPVNLAFLVLLLLIGAGAIGLSIVDLFGLPLFFNDAATISGMEALPPDPQFSFFITNESLPTQPLGLGDSPYELNVTMNTPPLTGDHRIEVFVVAGGKILSKTTCPEEDKEVNYTGSTQITCLIPLAYNYQTEEDARIYATIEDRRADVKSTAPAIPMRLDWGGYEGAFWASLSAILLITIAGFMVVAAVGGAMLFFATRIKHETEYAGEFTLESFLIPLKNVKTISQAFQAYIASPLFWVPELAGIALILLYFTISVEPWRSPAALFAFLLSGLLSFITPFLWVALMWFADYKEREPLRMVVSLFLWGGFACLMAIGANSFGSLFFALCGLGFIAASFTAPLFEELFKGTGLAIFSFHHEYDTMVDGIVYGFVVGMGFSFVEDWLYLLNNPMGADTWSWSFVFIMRSIFFSANHGVFTALTGGAIGLLKQWKFPYATLGLVGGMLPAMLLHAIHNSGEIWTALLGSIGFCTYCCILIPIFDYGGFVVVALLLIGGVIFTQGREKEILPPPEPVKKILGK